MYPQGDLLKIIRQSSRSGNHVLDRQLKNRNEYMSDLIVK